MSINRILGKLVRIISPITSIVPTSVNYNELPYIINWRMGNGIFPLIGQLENARSCSKIYKDLEVTKKI